MPDTEIIVDLEFLVKAAAKRHGACSALLASIYANDLLGTKVEPSTGKMTLRTCKEIMNRLR